MPTATCPDRQQLSDYLIGKLPDDASDAVASHLESCPECQAGLATLADADDTLVARLRGPVAPDPFLNEPECGQAIARAKAVGDGQGAAAAVAQNWRESGAAAPLGDEPPATSEPSLPQQLGEYELIERLGSGSMGTVYKALHNRLDRVVALKVLPRGRTDDPRAVVRFEREMKAIGRLDHAHIVRAYDAREIEGRLVLVMEFVEGLDLRRLTRRLGRLGTADACELARQAALGLQAAHEHGLVHRDIKPSNLMLAPEGQVKVLDLGLARFHGGLLPSGGKGDSPHLCEAPEGPFRQMGTVPFSPPGVSPSVGAAVELPPQRIDPPDDELTGTGQAMGTADYMAPEQASDSRAVDIRADVYSLGATLYKLLSGRAPFGGPDHQGTFDKLLAHRQEPIPPIGQLCPEIPDGLAAVLDRMLAKSPEARYATPAEAAEALSPWCAGADLPALLQRAVASPPSPLPPGEGAGGATPSPLLPGEGQGEGKSSPQPLVASRRWRSMIARLAVLLLVGGFGLALGIVITITRDGQKTTVEIPEGSSANVGADGRIDVKLRGQTKSTERVAASKMARDLPKDFAKLRPISPEAAAVLDSAKDCFHSVLEAHKKGDNAALVEANGKLAAKVKELQTLLKGTAAEKPWAEQAKLLLAYAEAAVKHNDDRMLALVGPLEEWDIGAKGRAFHELIYPNHKLRKPAVAELPEAARGGAATEEAGVWRGTSNSAKEQEALKTAKTQIGLFNAAMGTYEATVGAFPTTAQGLQALRVRPPDVDSARWAGPYLGSDPPLDPWGKPYQYLCPAQHNPDSYDVWTVGPTGEIGNWSETKGGSSASPPTVTVARPIVREITDYEEFPGHIEAARTAEIRARVTGYLDKVRFKEGAMVKQGEVLFEIDPKPFEAQASKSAAELTEAKRRATQANRQVAVRREANTLKPGAISDTEIVKAEGEQAAAAAAVRTAEEVADRAKCNLDLTKVTAPISGKIGRSLVDVGNLVTADNTLLATIVSVDPMCVTFAVDMRTVLRIRRMMREDKGKGEGQPALSVLCGLADDKGFPYRGQVESTEPSIDPATGTAHWRAMLPNPDGVLMPGMFARVRLTIGAPHKVLMVPASALRSDQDQKFAFVVNDQNVLQSRAVKVGQRDDALRVVTEGLTADDWVVTSVVQNLRPGMTVKPEKTGQPASKEPPSTPAATPATSAAAEFRALEGAWKVVRVDASDAAARFRDAYRLDFLPNMAVLTYARKSAHDTFYSYSIDPTKAPRTIDLFAGAERKNLAWLGIYQLEGDRLTICLNGNIPALQTQQRPNRFDRTAGDAVFVLERYRPSEDEKALQGGWTLVSQTEDGKSISKDKLRRSSLTFMPGNVFMSNLRFHEDNYERIIMLGTHVTDPAKEPKRITLFSRLQPMQSSDRVEEVELVGIYKLEGDRLTIAFRKGGPPPEKLESLPGSGVTLLALERYTPNRADRPRPGGTDMGEAERSPIFRTVAVTRGDIVATISATGTVEPEEVVDIGTQVAGQIVKFGFDPRGKTDPNYKNKSIDYNSPVDKGTVLAEIDPIPYKSQRDEAAAALERAKADLLQLKAKHDLSERQWKRAQDLRSSKNISDTDYEAFETEYKTAQASLAGGQAAVQQAALVLERADTNLSYTVIKSPTKGVIIDRRVNIGQNVAVGGPSLFLIAKDIEKLQVWASVNEADIGLIKEGMDVRFTVDAFPGQVFKGKVVQKRLNAQLTQNVVTYTVVVAVENGQRKLIPYMTANLQFIVETRANVLRVPNAALRWKPSRSDFVAPGESSAAVSAKDQGSLGRLWVKAPDGQHVRPLTVQVGLSDGSLTEVSGADVKEGMEVVIGEAAAGQPGGESGIPFAPRAFNAKPAPPPAADHR